MAKYPYNPKPDAITEIYNNLKNHKFKKALVLISKYLSTKGNGVYDELLDIYIDCQIKLGLFDEAKKNLAIMIEYFPHFYKDRPYELALRYASCCQSKKLKEHLQANNLSEEQCCAIAKSCYENLNFDLAEELFNLLITSSSTEKILKESKEHLRLIKIYKENRNKAFPSQTYGCFKYHGNRLAPGHVVFSSQIREYYDENSNLNTREMKKCPYMIWKIEGCKIYAFQVTTKLNGFSYVFSKSNYPTRECDRCLKNRLVCLNEHDITAVIDKITDYDYNKAIESMFIFNIPSQEGALPPKPRVLKPSQQ